jgi:phage terminase small subunit
MEQMKLTRKEQKFCELVLTGKSQTQSYKEAGYKSKNDRSAGACAVQVLAKPRVAEYIAKRQLEINEKLKEATQVTKERIVAELAKVAFANMSDFAKIDGQTVTFTNFENLKPDQLSAVCEVGETVGRSGVSLHLKLHNKIDALTKLGEQLGIFQPRKIQLSTEDGQALPFCLIPAQRKK